MVIEPKGNWKNLQLDLILNSLFNFANVPCLISVVGVFGRKFNFGFVVLVVYFFKNSEVLVYKMAALWEKF